MLQRLCRKVDKIAVIPILLRPVDWEGSPFSALQMLPSEAKPVTLWANEDDAFTDIARGIRRTIKEKYPGSISSSGAYSPGQGQGDVAEVPIPNLAQINEVEARIPTQSTNISSAPRLQPQQHKDPSQRRHTPSSILRVINPSRNTNRFRGIFLGLVLLAVILGGSEALYIRLNPIPYASAYDNAVAAQGIQFGVDARHTHYNPYEENLTFSSVRNLKQTWKAQTGDEVRSSPAVANGKVYVGSRDKYLYVFNAECDQSCQPIWKAQTEYQIDSSPAVFHGKVYIGSDDTYLYAFDANGCGESVCSPIWKIKTQGPVDTSPTVANSVVYIDAGGKLYAVREDRSYVWQPFSPPSQPSQLAHFVFSPVVDNGTLYIGASDGKLYAFKVQDCIQGSCSPLWIAQTAGKIHSSPTVTDGKIYVSTGEELYAFDANGCGKSTCAFVWKAQMKSSSDSLDEDGPFSSPAVANKNVYIGSADGKLYVFSADGCGKPTCLPTWTAQTREAISSSPTVAKGVVYIGSTDGVLYAFDANGCGKPTCGPDSARTYVVNDAIKSSPAVANSRVYISAGNNIFAFSLK